MTDDLHRRFDLESGKLERLRKDEEIAYSAFCSARNARDFQERKVSALFREMMSRAQPEKR